VTAVLEVAGLSKRFGELRVLDRIELTVADRGVHSIIGPNGAGKTTLFNCITGLTKPDHGSVTLTGRDIATLAVVDRVRLGLVRTFQVSRVFDSLSASDNVRLALLKTSLKGRLGLRLGRPERHRTQERCRELLAEVGIAPASQELPVGTLSHADRRAVEVAMALACDPVVLCLDEPTAGIGTGETERMAELIGRLGEQMAVLLIEHRMSIVQSVSRHVSVLSHGAVLAQGPPEVVAADSRVQDAYLGRATAGRRAATPRPGTLPRRNAAPAEDLVLRDVRAGYGSSHVLHGVSLTAPQGRVTGILGRNGAGKTTTLATVMNLVPARSGSIRLGRRELTGNSTHAVARLGIALVPEDRGVFAELTVEENLRLAAGPGARLQDAYAEFPVLSERRQAKGSQLSGGQQQVLALARALVRGPQVVLLDEPTQGLSPAYVDVVIGHIRRLRERGVTVVLVEQSLDVVAAVADTVYLMRDGEIAAEFPGAELDRSHPLVAESLLLEPVPPDGGPGRHTPLSGRERSCSHMADGQITYSMVRAVRDETGASHEECQQVLEESGGDIARAAALWFARKTADAALSRGSSDGARRADEPQPERS
jgi:branched-chain amino acid transport system ATP-binding protein